MTLPPSAISPIKVAGESLRTSANHSVMVSINSYMERMRSMYELMDTMTEWFAEVRKLSPATLMGLMALGGKVTKLLELKERLLGGGARAPAGDDHAR